MLSRQILECVCRVEKTYLKIFDDLKVKLIFQEIFRFSYFAFIMFKLRKVIKDIKNIHIFDKTRVHGLDFGRETFYGNHHMTP